MSVKNRLFARNGHECTLPSSLEDLYMFKISTNIIVQIRNILIRFKMASEINFRTQCYLRSQKNLDAEHRRHFRHPLIIHPFSDLRKFWEIWMIFILMCQFIMIPIDVCFHERSMYSNFTKTTLWRKSRLYCDIICLIDVCVSFLTGYWDSKKGLVVLQPRKIAVHYLLTYFVADFVSSIPTDIVECWTKGKAYKSALVYMSTLKLLRIISLIRYYKQFCQAFAIDYSKYKVILIVLCYLLYYHIVSCVTIFITIQHLPDERHTSLYNKSRTSMPYNLVYCISYTYFYLFYESSRVINNAGFLRMTSTTNREQPVYTVLIWLLSRILYMYMTSLIVDVIISRTSSVQKYFELVSELQDYMEHRNLPEFLKSRLLSYQEFRFQKTYFREAEILGSISGQLQQDVILYSCRKLVENVDFFKNLPVSLLVRIVTVLQMETFMTNDVILKYDSQGDCMYFIGTGTVAIYTKSGLEVTHLYDGDHFGEVALVTDNPRRNAAVIAAEPSELYKLDHIDFRRAIMPYPDLLLKIERIAAERIEVISAMEERNMRQSVKAEIN